MNFLLAGAACIVLFVFMHTGVCILASVPIYMHLHTFRCTYGAGMYLSNGFVETYFGGHFGFCLWSFSVEVSLVCRCCVHCVGVCSHVHSGTVVSCISFCTISYCMVQYAALPYAWCFILRSCSVCLCTCASRYRYGIVLTWRHLVFLLSGAVCTCASFLHAYWYVHTCIRTIYMHFVYI